MASSKSKMTSRGLYLSHDLFVLVSGSVRLVKTRTGERTMKERQGQGERRRE